MSSTPLIPDALKDAIDKVLADWHSSDLILAVTKKDEKTGKFQEEYLSFGSSNYNAQATPFPIASNTKQFTALTLAMLMRDPDTKDRFPNGWRTPLKDVFPDFKLQDPIASEHLTFEDALCHRSGMPRHDYMYGNMGETGYTEYLHRLQYLPPSAEFREIPQYNNHCFNIMGYLPELLKQQSWASFVEERIFRQAGFKQTTLDLATAEKEGLMRSYFQDVPITSETRSEKSMRESKAFFARSGKGDRGWLEGTNVCAGGIFSTAKDTIRWVQILLSDGKHPSSGETVVDKDDLAVVRKTHMFAEDKAQWPEMGVKTAGLGFRGYTYRGHGLIEHGGGLPGYLSQIAHLPNDGLGVVLFSNDNDDGNEINQIVKHMVLDSLLGLPSINWQERYQGKDKEKLEKQDKEYASWPSENSKPSTPLSTAAGVYENPGYGAWPLAPFDPQDPTACPLLDAKDASAVAKYVKALPFKSRQFAILKSDKLFAQFLLLAHHENDKYRAFVAVCLQEKGTDRRIVSIVDGESSVTLRQDGLFFADNFWGGDKARQRSLKDPSCGEVYFAKQKQ